MTRLKGIARLVFDAVEQTTKLVEETHEDVVKRYVDVLSAAPELEQPVRQVDDARRLLTRGVYASIQLVNRGVSSLAEAGFALAEAGGKSESDERATPLRSNAMGSSRWWIESAEGVLNGMLGHYLEQRKNPLCTRMSLRHEGAVLPLDREGLSRVFPDPRKRLAIFIHGLSCTEWSWSIFAEQFHGDPNVNFGTLLRDDLGYTPLYLRYNSGKHISENGEQLAALLSELLTHFPGPVDEIILVGHSMGGLVARSAAHYGALANASWISRLKHVFCIGAPHLGAPLEQGTHLLASMLAAFDTPGTRIPAKILNLRSAGIKDLRYGYVVHEEWHDHDADTCATDMRQDLALVDGVGYYFIASTLLRDPEHPLAGIMGDLLVRLPSASGRHDLPERCIPFQIGKVFSGMHHIHLANHPDVYAQIRQWCTRT